MKKDEIRLNVMKYDQLWWNGMKNYELCLKIIENFFLDLINYLNWQNNRWIIKEIFEKSGLL